MFKRCEICDSTGHILITGTETCPGCAGREEIKEVIVRLNHVVHVMVIKR